MPRHKIRRPWLDYLVYLAVRLVVGVAQALTIEQSYAFARLLAGGDVSGRQAASRRSGWRTSAWRSATGTPRPSATGSSAGSTGISA